VTQSRGERVARNPEHAVDLATAGNLDTATVDFSFDASVVPRFLEGPAVSRFPSETGAS